MWNCRLARGMGKFTGCRHGFALTENNLGKASRRETDTVRLRDVASSQHYVKTSLRPRLHCAICKRPR